MDLFALAAQLVAIIGCGFYFNRLNSYEIESLKTCMGEMKSEISKLCSRVTILEQKVNEINLRMVEFSGLLSKQDAEFKMFMRCRRNPFTHRISKIDVSEDHL